MSVVTNKTPCPYHNIPILYSLFLLKGLLEPSLKALNQIFVPDLLVVISTSRHGGIESINGERIAVVTDENDSRSLDEVTNKLSYCLPCLQGSYYREFFIVRLRISGIFVHSVSSHHHACSIM